MCVEHLKRCKTSTLAFPILCGWICCVVFRTSNTVHGFLMYLPLHLSFQAGGWSVHQMSPSNEDASVAQWYGLGTLNPRTCSIFFIFVHGHRLSQEPACCFSTFPTFSTFSNQPSTWFQYGFRNLSGKSTCFQPGLWRSSVLTLTRVYSLTQSCQVYWSVFARAMHSTSIIR